MPFEDPLEILLDDAEKELLALIYQRPADELRTVVLDPFPSNAENEFSRVLGCLDCKVLPCLTLGDAD